MNILIGVTGGIAAYKSAELVRLIKERGDDVKVVMTASSTQFVGTLTFQALSGNRVYTELFESHSEKGMDHIELARWADLLLVAPATADFMAKLAHGMADDLLSTLCIATEAPIAIAPAMNLQMWMNPATQDNLSLLKKRGIQILGPGEGEQACGENGPGRMLEPEVLLDLLPSFYHTNLKSKKVVITAGPTREFLDPIRYLSNRSTGEMGYALARAAQRAGAGVTLISGPTSLPAPYGVERLSVVTAIEMQAAVKSAIQDCDIFISAAAVADYRPAKIEVQKIKKSDETLEIDWVRNPDILQELSEMNSRPYTVGFAAETENVNAFAKAKLLKKKLDMIVANHVGESHGFGDSLTSVSIMRAHNDEILNIEQKSKTEIAQQLIELISRLTKESKSSHDCSAQSTAK